MLQKDWKQLQSETIDWLRFPMAVAVVMLHYGIRWILDAEGALKVLCVIFQEGICRLAVPCFFLISGYLFFNRLWQWDWTVWKRKISSRFRTLLVPYILWNIIAFFAFWAFSNAHGEGLTLSQHFSNSGGIRFLWSVSGGLPLGVNDAPIDGPLWFIRDLIIFTLFTPIIHLFLRWTKSYGFIALLLVFLMVPGYIPEGFIFFLAGAALQMEKRNLLEDCWPLRKVLYVMSVALLVIFCFVCDNLYCGRLVKYLFLICGIGASFCLAADMLDRKAVRVIPFLAKSSFFIFAAHEVLILHKFAAPLVGAILPKNGQFWHCVEFFLTPAVAVSICLAILLLLDKLCPWLAGVLTGNRKVQSAK